MSLYDDAEKRIKALGTLIPCGFMLADEDILPVCDCGSCNLKCPAKKGVKDEEGDGCVYSHKRAACSAEQFGGRYIYFCPAGFVFCISDFLCDDRKGYLVAGPVMATRREDFIANDLYSRLDSDEIDSEKFSSYIDKIPYFPPEKITALSDMVHYAAQSLDLRDRRKEEEKLRLQQQIADYVQSIKSRLILGIDRFSPYPYDKEKLLVYAIKSGNDADARKYLNEILGYIFFASADNLDAIKLRAFELTVLISRAALDGGADESSVYQSSPQFISEFFSLNSIDDVCYRLTKMLKQFSSETFDTRTVKHASIISQVVSYIRNNYMHKITLDDAANHVYLSASYLSKIFKDEMHTNFNTYLSEVRIEKGKILLLSNELSIIEVAELVGFIDQSYFNKVFKKYVGMTPKKFRETNGEKDKSE